MADNKVLHWLKRLFSATSLGVILAAVTLYYTYNGYIDSTSGELSIQVNQEVIPLPATESGISRIAELCLVNDSTFNLNSKAKMPELKNKSSRAINNLNYEILILPNKDVDFQLGDEFESANKKVHCKFEKLKAFQTVSGPIQRLSFSARQLCIQFNYNIAFDGVKEPIKFPYYLYFYNLRDKDLSQENYLFLRNSFLKICYDNFKNEAKDTKIIITVGDTTVNVKDPKFLNLDEYPIASLSELEEDHDKSEFSSHSFWYNILIAGILIFLVGFLMTMVTALDECYENNKRLPNFREYFEAFKDGFEIMMLMALITWICWILSLLFEQYC